MKRRELLSLTLPAAMRAQPGRDGRVRITKFVLHKATHRWRDLLFLEIHTDAGLVGVGEGSLATRVDLVETALRWLEPNMVGLDPAGPERHWDRNYWGLSRWRNGPDIMTAISAVDIALWDIEGQRLGVPVWRLLGGPLRAQTRVYFTHWNNELPARTPEGFAERAAKSKEEGWTAVKWPIARGEVESARAREIAQTLEAIRKRVGDDFDFGLEMYENFSLRSALEFAKVVAPYRPMFLEEPIWREMPGAFAEMAAKSPVPIATGEGLQMRHEFEHLFRVRGCQIIQPDVLHCGGITEIRKIAHMAEVHGIEIAPHQCYGPVAHVASLAASTVCKNFYIQEWEADDDAVYAELTGGKYPRQKNGFVGLPMDAGLGIRPDLPELVRRFPYRPRKPTAAPSFTYYDQLQK
jgi:galactonate dehydratase